MKKSNLFWLFFLFCFYLLGSCANIPDIEDPASMNAPTMLSSFTSLQDLSAQSLISGKVPLYSTNANKSGLISLGDANGCVVMVSGKLKCWGANTNGQLGDGSLTNNPTPHLATNVNPTSGVDIIVAVAAGRTSTCAFYFSGYKCWGRQNFGVLGNGVTVGNALTAQTVTNAAGKILRSVQLNDGCSCILDTSGIVTCWGDNSSGQLGDGTTTSTTSGTTASLGGLAVSALISHNSDSCALLSNNTTRCWGFDFGSTPTLINTSKPISFLGGGTTFGPTSICAVLTDGTAQCFGTTANAEGELGNGTNTAPSSSTQGYTVLKSGGQTLTGVNMIASGDGNAAGTQSFTCAVVSNYTSVYCWGTGALGSLGNGSIANSNVAVKVTQTWPSSDIIDLAVSDARACILLENNDVWCWGGNLYGSGELGNGSLTGNTNTAIKILNRNDP